MLTDLDRPDRPSANALPAGRFGGHTGKRWIGRTKAPVALLDQAVSSGTNLLTSVVAAHVLGLERFGPVVLAMSAAYLGIAVVRAICGEPLLALLGHIQPERRADAVRGALTTALIVGTACGVALAVIGWTGPGVTRLLPWVAIYLPAMCLQDAVRYLAFAHREPLVALLSDSVWCVVQVAALAALLLGSANTTPGQFLSCWGLGAVAGALFAFHYARQLRSPSPWIRVARQYSGWMTLQTLIAQSETQLMLVVIAAVSGATQLAQFRGAQLVCYMPIAAALVGLIAISVPAYARLDAEPSQLRGAVRRARWRWSAAAAAVAALVLIARGPVLQAALGGSFGAAAAAMWPLGIAAVAHAAAAPYGSALRALRAGRRIFSTQLATTLLLIPSVAVGASVGGSAGAAWAVALDSAWLVVVARYNLNALLSQAVPAAEEQPAQVAMME